MLFHNIRLLLQFQHMADLFNISVRTGCFCNSGSCQRHLNVTNKEMKSMHKAGHKCGDEMDLVNNKPTGAIRVSFGYYNTFNDVDRLIAMITRCFVKRQYHQRKRFTVSFYEKQIDTNETDFIKEIYSVNESCIMNNIDPTTDSTESNIKLTELAIFPVKSCGAFKIKTGWMIGTKGFEYDREWMIVKDNGVCLTQKQSSRMCMIQPIIDLNKKCLTLTFKGEYTSIFTVTYRKTDQGYIYNKTKDIKSFKFIIYVEEAKKFFI